MNDFIQFVIHHWLLWLALVAIIVLLVLEEKRTNVKGVKKIAAQAATNLINHENAKVLDIRHDNEFKSGHLAGAINIPFADLEKDLKKLNKYKAKPIIVVCKMGQVSLKAGLLLHKNGFENVYSLNGGITGWQRAGLPLTKEK